MHTDEINNDRQDGKTETEQTAMETLGGNLTAGRDNDRDVSSSAHTCRQNTGNT